MWTENSAYIIKVKSIPYTQPWLKMTADWITSLSRVMPSIIWNEIEASLKN